MGHANARKFRRVFGFEIEAPCDPGGAACRTVGAYSAFQSAGQVGRGLAVERYPRLKVSGRGFEYQKRMGRNLGGFRAVEVVKLNQLSIWARPDEIGRASGRERVWIS